MKYKVNIGSPVLASFFGGGIVGLSGCAVIVPAPYKWIIYGIEMILLASVAWWVAVIAWRNRSISFGESVLVFPKRAIYPEEIKHIVTQERWSYFIIYFKRRQAPISISFRKRDTDHILSELRQWVWRNKVLCQTKQMKRG